MLSIMLIAIFYSSSVCAHSESQCDDAIATVVFERPDSSSRSAKISIANTIDEDICYELGHGVRAFRLTRSGRDIPVNADVPFVSLRDRCQVIRPGEKTIEEFEIGSAFPSLLPRDELCFSARVRLRAQQDAPNSTVVACQVIE